VNENDKRHYSKEDYRELAAPFIKQQSVINTRSLQIQNPTKRKLHPQRKKKQQEGEKEKEGEDILSDEEEDNLERVLQLPYPSKKEWLISKGKRLKDNTKENTLIIYIKKYFKDRRS